MDKNKVKLVFKYRDGWSKNHSASLHGNVSLIIKMSVFAGNMQ